MEIRALQNRHIDVSNLPLERLASSQQVSEQQKLGEASRAFEAILLRQILQEAQRPVFASKLTGNSTASGIYRDIVVNQMAENISKSGSLGLAKGLASEMQRSSAKAGAVHPGLHQAEPNL